jgi:hypothetical protein
VRIRVRVSKSTRAWRKIQKERIAKNTTPLQALALTPPHPPPQANLHFGFLGESSEETTIVGTGGRIIIHTPAHCPTSITVITKQPGADRGEVSKETLTFPLPITPDDVKDSGGYYYPNSAGLAYEAAAVQRCVGGGGGNETPQYTREEMLKVMEIIDEYKKQIGIETGGEEEKVEGKVEVKT